MTKGNQIGVFWGNETLYFVESENSEPKRVFHVPLEQKSDGNSNKGPADNIRKAFNEQNITSNSVNLSLPTQDIIFRSFIIPWMHQNEIQNVVEFEIGKYIPFSLEELSFAFQSITIEQDNLKLMRIVFVAIKKDTLENCIQILRSAGLETNIMEPAALSVIRTLRFKNLFPQNQTVALIEKETVGRIIIIDNDILQFVREFHLSSLSISEVSGDPDSEVKKLTKEARISLDYFNRQNEQLQVKKIFLLTAHHQEELAKNLEKSLDLNIPISAIDGHAIIEEASEVGIGILNAYGASMATDLDSPMSFSRVKDAPPKPITQKQPVSLAVKTKSVIVSVLVCVPLIVFSLLLSKWIVQTRAKKVDSLNQKLALYQDMDISTLETQEILLMKKLDYFQNIRMQTDTALYLLIIPDLLPDGTWINKLDIDYDDSEMFAQTKKMAGAKTNEKPSVPVLTITIDGYAFSKDKNQQFRLVNMFLSQLKKNENFSYFFPTIDLTTTNIERIEDQEVTFFQIVCKQKNELKRSK